MPRRNEDREAQVAIPVSDRAAEIGINLNTVLSGLMLAGTIGVITLLFSINAKMSDISTVVAVVQANAASLKVDFDEHRRDPFAHHNGAPHK